MFAESKINSNWSDAAATVAGLVFGVDIVNPEILES